MVIGFEAGRYGIELEKGLRFASTLFQRLLVNKYPVKSFVQNSFVIIFVCAEGLVRIAEDQLF